MKSQYEPKTREQFYAYLIEEAGEVIAAAGKTLRWGDDSVNPELPRDSSPETNIEWVRREVADLRGAIDRWEKWAAASSMCVTDTAKPQLGKFGCPNCDWVRCDRWPECKKPHPAVCENSRSCVQCQEVIAPMYGLCFDCHTKRVEELSLRERRFSDEEWSFLDFGLSMMNSGFPRDHIRKLLDDDKKLPPRKPLLRAEGDV